MRWFRWVLLLLVIGLLGPDTALAERGSPTYREAEVMAHMKAWSKVAKATVDEFIEDYNTSPQDQAWANRVRLHLGVWSALNRQAQELDPPDTLQAMYGMFLEGMQCLADAGDLFLETLDDPIQRMMASNQGGELLQCGMDRMIDSLRAITAFMDGSPTPPTSMSRPTETPLPTLTPIVQPTTPSPATPVPAGEAVQTALWAISVDNAWMAPAPPSHTASGFLVVTLNIQNVSDAPRPFVGSEIKWMVTSSDGRTYTDSLVPTAQVRVANDEWTGVFSSGPTYSLSAAFGIFPGDPHLYPDEPSGWTLTITDEDGRICLFDLGF